MSTFTSEEHTLVADERGYIILRRHYTTSMTFAVEELVALGYKPVGGIAYDGHKGEYYQAMFKG